MPLDPKLTKYTTTSPVLVNLNFIEFASGTSLVSMYLGKTVDKVKMSSSTWYSDRIFSQSDTSLTTSFVKLVDEDFDVEFNKIATVEGETVINVPWGFRSRDNTHTISGYLVVSVIHYDGSTETVLATNQGTTRSTSVANGDFMYDMSAIDLDVTKKRFKAGEILRVTVELWIKSNANQSGISFIAHDPKNRATTDAEGDTGTGANDITMGTNPSIATFQMPVRTT